MSATVKLPRLSRTRDRFVAVGVVLLVVIAAFAVTAVLGASPGIGTEQRMIDGGAGAGAGGGPTRLHCLLAGEHPGSGGVACARFRG